MHENRLDWNHLQTALNIARTGNLSKAAKALGINQSTASRHLMSLEDQVGLPLFHRSKTAMQITEAGSIIVAEAEVMESALLTAIERTGNRRSDVKGLIRYVAIPWVTSYLITPRLVEFWNRFPHVEIQAIGDPRERFLDKSEADLSLRFDTHTSPNIDKIPAAEIAYSVYASRDLDPDRLPWMGFREDEYRTVVETWLLKATAGTTVRFWANDAGILRQAALAGAGKALLPDFLAAGDPQLVRVSDINLTRTLWIQVLPQMRRLKRISEFVDWLRYELKRVPQL
jgi:DNA-binding transcriptional LysR family regulator